MQGAGRVVFAGIMLLVLGTLNIIYGIGALDNANVFVNDTRLVLDDLNSLGWLLIIWGVLELVGGFSLLAGNAFGRIMGIFVGSFGAVIALFSMGSGFPFWSLAMFALSCWVVWGIIIYGEDLDEI
jgi:hypothetical protein